MKTAIAALSIAVMALSACATGNDEGGVVDLYKSNEAKSIAFTSYDRAMELWPVGFEEEWVQTRFGTTHIIVSGDEGAPPVFLMPGLFADATMWYANVGPLAREHRVYCIDLPVFGGKSEPSGAKIGDINDYASWFQALIEHYGYRRVAVGGLSYGSWLSLALAREVPGSIAAIIMLDPSETFIKMDGGIAWRGFWDFAFFPNRSKYRRFFLWISGGYTDPQSEIWLEHMLDVIEYGSVGMFDVPQHRIYTAEELGMVTMPILVMAGGKPILYKDPEKFATAARAALPQAEIVIVPGTGHSLNAEKANEVNDRMVRFLSQNYG